MVDGTPSFYNEVVAALHKKSKNSKSGDLLLCSLIMAEVAIRKPLDYNKAADPFVGYVNMSVELSDSSGLSLAS